MLSAVENDSAHAHPVQEENAPQDWQRVALENVIQSSQEFTTHIILLLDTLKDMIPDPDNEGIKAADFVRLMTAHSEYHSDTIGREMVAIKRAMGEAA
ncbi:hypothetical protein GS501_00035 [Saccharibacter sp. 17.LH.SD]|uniref:hypothetical protein n=1 Tax=Saccharibacter sp. 17.LH.SD TaxID=2689393 RepID=UPI00136E34B8|nr:hypothetical protein [Saccharibacter sp. 17.LH.SD]MXV43469.1 hypothetical protein [Saccharibacter sp. 17.LH.SD]